MAFTDTQGQITINRVKVDLSKADLSDTANQSAALVKNSQLRTFFLQDLLMFAEGDLFVDEENSQKGDLKLAAGLYNFAQAITHRLMTDRGTHPEDAFFGVPWSNYIGQVYNSQSIVYSNLIQDITDELYKDNRTQQVVYVKPNFIDSTTIEVECAVLPINISTSVLVSLSLGVT